MSTIRTTTKKGGKLRKKIPEKQATREAKIDTGITITTLKQDWGKKNEQEQEEAANKARNRNKTPIQQAKEMLENTHDQASREMYAEKQRALTKRTIIPDPPTIQMCIEEAKKGHRGKLLDAMGKESDLLILGLWEYIRHWADRLLAKLPMDVGELYQILENHGVETHALSKANGTVVLVKQHLENTPRNRNAVQLQHTRARSESGSTV